MARPEIYVVVNGNPFLDRCREYKEEYARVHTLLSNYSTKTGAEAYHADFRSGLIGLRFPVAAGHNGWRRSAPGWSAAKGRNNVSTPLKKSVEVMEEIAKLPLPPNPYMVFKDIPLQLEYSYDSEWDGKISRAKASETLISTIDPQIEWTLLDNETVFILTIPDVQKRIEEIKADDYYQNVSFANDIELWEPPYTLNRISKVRRDYMFALSRLQREEAGEVVEADED